MKVRYSFVQLNPGTVRPPTGVSKDGSFDSAHGYQLDREGDTLIIRNDRHWKGEIRHVPWSAVMEAVVDMQHAVEGEVQAMATDVLGGRADVMAGKFPGQKVDGRTREAKAAKANEP